MSCADWQNWGLPSERYPPTQHAQPSFTLFHSLPLCLSYCQLVMTSINCQGQDRKTTFHTHEASTVFYVHAHILSGAFQVLHKFYHWDFWKCQHTVWFLFFIFLQLVLQVELLYLQVCCGIKWVYEKFIYTVHLVPGIYSQWLFPQVNFPYTIMY